MKVLYYYAKINENVEVNSTRVTFTPEGSSGSYMYFIATQD